MTRRSLSIEEELFSLHFAATGNGAAAFRAAYPESAKGRTSDRCSERARVIRKRPHVATRVNELRAKPQSEWEETASTASEGATLPRSGPLAGAHDATAARVAGTAGGAGHGSEAMEPDAIALAAEIEQLALVAFDDAASDLMRLLALRSMTALLHQWRARHHTSALRVFVNIEVPQTDAPAPRDAAASGDGGPGVPVAG